MNRNAQVDKFMQHYAPALADAAENHPNEYGFSVDQAPVVAERMRMAFVSGSYNHDGRAIRTACRMLGIKHTRTAMEAFFTA